MELIANESVSREFIQRSERNSVAVRYFIRAKVLVEKLGI